MVCQGIGQAEVAQIGSGEQQHRTRDRLHSSSWSSGSCHSMSGNVLQMDPRDWGCDSYGARPGWRIREKL